MSDFTLKFTPILTVEEYLTRTYYNVPYVMNRTFKDSHMDAHFDANTGRWFTGGGAMDTDSFSDTDDEAFSHGLLYRNEFPEVVLKIGRSAKKTQGRAKNKGLTFNPEIVHWILRGEHAQYADTNAWCIKHHLVYDANQPRVDLGHLDLHNDHNLRGKLKKKGGLFYVPVPRAATARHHHTDTHPARQPPTHRTGAEFDGKVWFIPAGTGNANVKFAAWLPSAGPPATAPAPPTAPAATAPAATVVGAEYPAGRGHGIYDSPTANAEAADAGVAAALNREMDPSTPTKTHGRARNASPAKKNKAKKRGAASHGDRGATPKRQKKGKRIIRKAR